MTLLSLVLTLVIVGVILWGISQIPMPQWLKVVIQVIAIIAVIVYVAGFFGINLHIGHLSLAI